MVVFRIIDNINMEGGEIYSRSFKIGGEYKDCVNLTVHYNENQQAETAKIPTLLYDPECSLGKLLKKEGGTVIMIKALLRHVHKEIPEITQFLFDDKSTIECGTADELYRKRTRRRGTHAYPLSLTYFSMVHHGVTWYEKNFNARQANHATHRHYRASIKEWLTSPSYKHEFIGFLRIASPTQDIAEQLRPYYESTTTYGDFFAAIPKGDRCRLLRGWLEPFMKTQVPVSNQDWVIDIETMDTPPEWMFSSVKKGGMRRTRKRRTRTIRLSNYGNDVGASMDD